MKRRPSRWDSRQRKSKPFELPELPEGMSKGTFGAIKLAAITAVIRLEQGDDRVDVLVDLAVAAWLRGKKDASE